MNSEAWSLVTSAERDPARALGLATEAVNLTNRQDATILDTLAKALADSGRLEEAIRTQQEAMRLLTDPKTLKDYDTRLWDYERDLALKKLRPRP